MRMRTSTLLNQTKESINEFLGWDYMELACKWDLFNAESTACKLTGKVYCELSPELSVVTSSNVQPNLDDSKPLRQFLEDLIVKYMETHADEILKPYASDLRQFARKLSVEDESYYKPLWRGLARVEDDFTIVRASILLLPCMWS